MKKGDCIPFWFFFANKDCNIKEEVSFLTFLETILLPVLLYLYPNQMNLCLSSSFSIVNEYKLSSEQLSAVIYRLISYTKD